ncbi:Glyoxylase B2 [Colletotrichum orbiculare MAFF 240422]|uniref:Glyoxylase B2 n=1 Tax=Colletotrichum orbiculare (strain 104-T / ATCC 96160 / CBS 514.97 / LARS 414 / MAFF 240422) TaxID=1213857 RepID=A0A484FR74_COLOR|nr:Glyoxylase B2 [Colletotrichum orbiculare MAFF 240422]
MTFSSPEQGLGKGYHVQRILETHAHADHLTAASYLQARLSGTQTNKPAIGIGKRIGQVQTLFGHRYGVAQHEREGVFDKLFEDDEAFSIGNIQAIAIHLPGHTPDHLGYMIGDNVFCGDSLFHVDIGTARCDFPGGSASNLYRSGRRLLSLPGHVKIWTGHDYPPDGRTDPVPWTTVQDHRAHNKHLKDGIAEDEADGVGAQDVACAIEIGRPFMVNEEQAHELIIPCVNGNQPVRLFA